MSMNDKELSISKALTVNELRLENDITTFIRYIEEDKRAKKIMDEVIKNKKKFQKSLLIIYHLIP